MLLDPRAHQRRAAEGELRASEESYRAIFEQAAVGIVHTSLKGKIRLANPAFCAMGGYSAEEVRQLHIREITHPDDIDASIESRAALVKGAGVPYQKELRVRRKVGKSRV
jgi:PAS domain S-box-containing protein